MIATMLGSEVLIGDVNDSESMENWMFLNGVMLFPIISGCLQMSQDDNKRIRMISKMPGSEILIGNVNDDENMKDNVRGLPISIYYFHIFLHFSTSLFFVIFTLP
jgi:hypothetical protein